MDLENVPERKVSVTMWIRDLSVAICRKRMEHCLKTHLEALSRAVLGEFKDLFEKYCQHNYGPLRSELNPCITAACNDFVRDEYSRVIGIPYFSSS